MSKTLKLSVTIPQLIEVSAGEATENFDLSKLPEDKLAEFVAMAAQVGIMKSGNDSASGAKAYAAKNKLDIEVARAELIGKWCEARYESGGFDRRTGDGMSTVEKEAVRACRRAVKESDEKWYKSADEEAKWSRMVEYFDGLDQTKKDGLLAWAKAEVERKAAVAKARQDALAAVKDLGIDI